MELPLWLIFHPAASKNVLSEETIHYLSNRNKVPKPPIVFFSYNFLIRGEQTLKSIPTDTPWCELKKLSCGKKPTKCT